MTRRISLSLLTVAAMFSMSCDNKPKGQVTRCIDVDGRVVVDDKCDQQSPVARGYGPYPLYRWYYGGSGYGVGQLAGGGSFQPAPELPVYRATSPEGSAILRGGFGQGFTGVGS